MKFTHKAMPVGTKIDIARVRSHARSSLADSFLTRFFVGYGSAIGSSELLDADRFSWKLPGSESISDVTFHKTVSRSRPKGCSQAQNTTRRSKQDMVGSHFVKEREAVQLSDDKQGAPSIGGKIRYSNLEIRKGKLSSYSAIECMFHASVRCDGLYPNELISQLYFKFPTQ